MFKKFLIKKLGGFTDTDDFIRNIRTLKTEEKYRILTIAVKRLFNTVGSDDILSNKNGDYRFEGRPITKGEIDNLRAQAESFVQSKLFVALDKEVKYHCNLQMRKATTLSQLEGAKVIEFTWDILKTKLRNI